MDHHILDQTKRPTLGDMLREQQHRIQHVERATQMLPQSLPMHLALATCPTANDGCVRTTSSSYTLAFHGSSFITAPWLHYGLTVNPDSATMSLRTRIGVGPNPEAVTYTTLVEKTGISGTTSYSHFYDLEEELNTPVIGLYGDFLVEMKVDSGTAARVKILFSPMFAEYQFDQPINP